MISRYIFEFRESFASMCAITAAKCIGFFIVVLAHIAFGKVDAVVLSGVMVLIMFDFITAIIRDAKIGVPIESKKAISTAVKFVVYGLMVSAAYITEAIVGLNAISVPFAEGVAGFIAVTELISIMENVDRMGYESPKKLIRSLKLFLRSK